MITELVEIKRKLLEQHKKYEMPNASEYREGVLGGIEVALNTIESMIEEEDRIMDKYQMSLRSISRKD